MTRFTYQQALTAAADPARQRSVDLIEARRVLRNVIEETPDALARVEAEMRGRSAFATNSGAFIQGAAL